MPRIPTLEEWIKGVNAVREAKDWVATCKGTEERFHAVWAPWSEYVSDPVNVSSSLDAALLELADPTLKALRLAGARETTI